MRLNVSGLGIQAIAELKPRLLALMCVCGVCVDCENVKQKYPAINAGYIVG